MAVLRCGVLVCVCVCVRAACVQDFGETLFVGDSALGSGDLLEGCMILEMNFSTLTGVASPRWQGASGRLESPNS